jgi:O-antigen/teichoic acid export membrane protein
MAADVATVGLMQPAIAEELHPATASELASGSPDGGEPSSGVSHIRGSSLLLVGRASTMAVNFVIQLLIVRHLTKSEYGAFAYALSLASLTQSFITLGLDKGVGRFLPMYDEAGDRSRMAGAIAFLVGTVTGLGLLAIVALYLFRGWLGSHVITDPSALSLLLVLVALAPAQAIDDAITSLFAVFAKPKSIFFRRYVIEPMLRLGVVVAVVAGGSGVRTLAIGYVGACVLGALGYGYLLLGLLRSHHLLGWFRPRRITVPWKEVLAFSIPLLTTDLVFVALGTTDAVLLAHFRNITEVASIRAVAPLAGMNLLVMSSFTILFGPAAARLYARKDQRGVHDLYWRSAIWIAVLTFPLFALSTTVGGAITSLYGARYASSAPILALLAIGNYANAAVGFNGLTIRIYGRLGIIMAANLGALVANIGLGFLLIPRFGAVGAAVGTCLTMIAHNIMKQIGLQIATGISFFDKQYLRVYGGIAVAMLVLGGAAVAFHPSPIVGVLLAGVAWLALVRVSRRQLAVAETFPELLRIPGVGPLAAWFLGGPGHARTAGRGV